MKQEFTKDELIRAVIDYIDAVGEAEGVDFINYIANKRSRKIIKIINNHRRSK